MLSTATSPYITLTDIGITAVTVESCLLSLVIPSPNKRQGHEVGGLVSAWWPPVRVAFCLTPPVAYYTSFIYTTIYNN